ncbi:MAG: DUF4884 domain-containing protein [Bacteroidales bacterium]
MKTLFKSLLILIVSCEFLSCTRQIPISKVTPENNKTYKVEFLFEYDGCKVYRFQDYGYPVYFTNCNGEITSIKSDSTKNRTINVIGNDTKK